MRDRFSLTHRFPFGAFVGVCAKHCASRYPALHIATFSSAALQAFLCGMREKEKTEILSHEPSPRDLLFPAVNADRAEDLSEDRCRSPKIFPWGHVRKWNEQFAPTIDPNQDVLSAGPVNIMVSLVDRHERLSPGECST